MSADNHIINYDSAVKDLNSTLKTHLAQLSEVVKEYNKLNASMSSLPSEYVNKLNAVVTANEKISQSNEKVVNSTNNINKAVQQTLNTGASLAKQKEKEAIASERASKALEKEAQALEKANNVYNKVQAKVNAMTQTYNNLATKRELGLKLTDKELRNLALLEARLTKYNGVLKGIDANIGKHQRNVGNYASSWNGLGNSINQITREMPAFAVSMNTGFLAISNNLPMLFDEIKRTKEGIASLRAEGKPTQGLFTTLMGNIFSFQTLLSVGVTLLTIYGKELVEWALSAWKGDSAISSLTKSTEAYNEALKSGDYKTAYENVTKVGIAFEQAKKGTVSKKEALQIYNETLGDTFGRTNDLNKAEDLYNKNAGNYIKAMLARASANHLLAKSAELNAKIIQERNKGEVSIWEKAGAWLKNGLAPVSASGYDATTLALINRGQKINDATKEIEENQKAVEGFFEDFEKYSKGMNLDNVFGDFSVGSKKEEEAKEEKDLSWEIREQELQNQIAIARGFEEQMEKRYQLVQEWYQNQLKEHKDNAQAMELASKQYTAKLIELNKEEYDHAVKIEDAKAKLLLDVRKALLKAEEDLNKQRDKANKKRDDDEKKRLEDIAKRMQGFLQSSFGSSMSGLGFGSIGEFFNSELMDMWKTTESTTEKMAIAFQVFGNVVGDVFAKLNEVSANYYQRQQDRLEQDKEVAIKYAGENADAREAIEEQYNKRALELKRQQAKREKEIAIFQTSLNTAQAIMSIWAQVPKVDFGISATALSAMVGALGVAQMAMIASRPLPQFYKGTDNAPQGWAIVDELRPEVHTDKKGNIKSFGSSGGANLRYLEQGDKIYKSHSDFFREMSGSYVNPNGQIVMNNGITKEEMSEVMKASIPSIQEVHFDENGIKRYIKKSNSRTEIRNKRINFNK